MIEPHERTPGRLCWVVSGNDSHAVNVAPGRVHTNEPKPAGYRVTVQTVRRVYDVEPANVFTDEEAAWNAARVLLAASAPTPGVWALTPPCAYCKEERDRADDLRRRVLAVAGVRPSTVARIEAEEAAQQDPTPPHLDVNAARR